MNLSIAALDTQAEQHRLGNDRRAAEGAVFVTNPAVPRIRDANHVSSVTASTPAGIDSLLAEVKTAYRDYPHRAFEVDGRTPSGFVARLLLDGGYSRTDGLLLVLEGDLNGSAEPRDIRPISSPADWEAFWELMLLDWKESEAKEGRDSAEEVAREMWQTKPLKQPPMQYWLAYDRERPVGYFSSWSGVNGVGQVENLFTHPDFRNRGIARSLIFHCVAESRRAGAGPVVIAADPGDTPRNLYAALGFRPVAVASSYWKQLD